MENVFYWGGAIMPFSKKVVSLLIEKHWYEKILVSYLYNFRKWNSESSAPIEVMLHNLYSQGNKFIILYPFSHKSVTFPPEQCCK